MHRQPISPEFLQILACPVCKSDVMHQDDGLVCVGSGCGLRFPMVDGIPVMLPPGMTTDLILTKKAWDARYESQRVKGMDLENEPELRDALTHIANSMNTTEGLFLEVGSGLSRVSCALARGGARTIGIDISLSAVQSAKELFKNEGVTGFLVNADMLHMPFKDNTFSAMYAGGAIEHFEETGQCLRELLRCLSPGGVISATVPCISLSTPYIVLMRGNIPDLPVIGPVAKALQISLMKGRRMQFGYEKSFTPGGITKLFQGAGFSRIQSGLFDTYYPLTVFKYGCLKRMIARITKLRPFWPMIYINGSKDS